TLPSSKANLIVASSPEFSPSLSRIPAVSSSTDKSLVSSVTVISPQKKINRQDAKKAKKAARPWRSWRLGG
ncbi:MAG: hypothetical protein L0220_03515, partial [Acidobacteria bacterium]|nr:hypothetical protein [Acidobacteriota bacterium]